MSKKPKPEPSAFGRRLREMRLKAGMTQVALGELVGIDSAGMSDLETKPNANPKLSTIQKLAAALGCRACDLIGE